VETLLRALNPLPPGPATLLFGAGTSDAASAALVNGTAAHALDYDDVVLRGHPSAVLVPAILSLAAETGADGARMLDAYVAGYEVWADLVDRESDIHHMKGWHPTGIFGAISASAASAVLMRLDNAQCAHAIGLGATQSAGLMSNFGAMAKAFHAGRAAQAGVVSARLARAGFTASLDALEHPQGFLTAVSPAGQVDRDRSATAGAPFQIVRRRMNVKRYPLCYYTHRALDGLLALQAAHGLRAEEVEHVEVRMSQEHATVLRNHRPSTGLEAKFSIEFAMACALVAGRAGLTELTDDFVQQALVQRVIERVHVTPIPADDPETPAAAYADQVIVTVRDGKRLAADPVHQALGHAQRPMDRLQLQAKFVDALAHGRYEGDSLALFERLSTLDRQSRPPA
jgi:2-methylcitrate dehydratase PrpD